jgi:hypothetical protein
LRYETSIIAALISRRRANPLEGSRVTAYPHLGRVNNSPVRSSLCNASAPGRLSPGLDRAALRVPRRVLPSFPLAIPFDSPARGRNVHRPSVLLRAAVFTLRVKTVGDCPASSTHDRLCLRSLLVVVSCPVAAFYRAGLKASLRLCALSCDGTTSAMYSVIRLRCSFSGRACRSSSVQG